MTACFLTFCTVVMNRLHHLRETLPVNVAQNADYPDLEFLILDYNSSDGLGQWLRESMMDHIRSGRLVYYKTDDPIFFDRAHSRNMAFRLASGEIITNIDADNFTGEKFAHYLHEMLSGDPKAFASLPIFDKQLSTARDVFGRIAIRKQDFIEVSGFDESMQGYGFEDFDIIQRLSRLPRRLVPILDEGFFRFISHPEDERYKNEAARNLLHRLLVSHRGPGRSELLFLFKDGTFSQGIIVDRHIVHPYPLPRHYYNPYIPRSIANTRWSLVAPYWTRGRWSENDKTLRLSFEDRALELIFLTTNKKEDLLAVDSEGRRYNELANLKSLDEIAQLYSILTNMAKMEFNHAHRVTRPNKSFGNGKVTRNFRSEDLILLEE